MDETQVDIQQIMEEIRQRAHEIEFELPVDFDTVAQENAHREAPGDLYEATQLWEAQAEMNSRYNVLFYRPIPGNPAARFFKKVIRKLIFPLLQPMADDTTLFNAASTRAVNQLSAYIREQEDENRRLKRAIHRLEQRIQALEANPKGEMTHEKP